MKSYIWCMLVLPFHSLPQQFVWLRSQCCDVMFIVPDWLCEHPVVACGTGVHSLAVLVEFNSWMI